MCSRIDRAVSLISSDKERIRESVLMLRRLVEETEALLQRSP
ncbi:hypothetical protein ACTHRH_14085 [Paenibacillus sp. SAFN-117]